MESLVGITCLPFTTATNCRCLYDKFCIECVEKQRAQRRQTARTLEKLPNPVSVSQKMTCEVNDEKYNLRTTKS